MRQLLVSQELDVPHADALQADGVQVSIESSTISGPKPDVVPAHALHPTQSLSQAAGQLLASLPTNVTLENSELYWRAQRRDAQACQQVAPGARGAGGYVALCALVRNQGPDMAEWLEHHLALGVSKIYVFDHHSNPPMYDWVVPYIQTGQVVYSYLHDAGRTTYTNSVQNWVYARCIQEFGHQHQFMGFLDPDEFIMFTPKSVVADLPTFLRAYEGYPGLGVQWLLFGSSGHEARPNGSVVANYWECSQDRHIKTIANLDWNPHTTTPPNPHIMAYEDRGQPDRKVVDEKYREVRGERQGALNEHFANDLIVLAHYVVKSMEEFKQKMERGSPTNDKIRRDMPFFDEMNRRAAGNDCRNFTARYLPQRR